MPTKTPNQALAEADQVAQLTIEIDSLKSQLKEALLSIQKNFAPQIEAKQKARTKITGRVRSWLSSHAAKLFPQKGSGIYKTGLSEISWKKTPESIVPLIKGTSEDDLVDLALRAGMEDAVRVKHIPNREYLSTLSDDELATIGWKKTTGHSLKITPLANTASRKN